MKIGNCALETCKKDLFYKKPKILVTIINEKGQKEHKFCNKECMKEWVNKDGQ